MDGDIEKLAAEVLSAARAIGCMVVTAESCTGGLIAGALTSVAGSSDVFDRGFVTYSNEAKQQMLGVSQSSLEFEGAVSEAVAKEMAYGALVNSMAEIAISVTGVAGPDGGTTEKPVGMVCFGIARLGLPPTSETVTFPAESRTEIREKTVEHALELLLSSLK